MSHYSCNLDGECEVDDVGWAYGNLPRCQLRCRPTNYDYQDKTIIYSTASYDLYLAIQLAPSDRIKFLRQELGIITDDAEESYIIIDRLLRKDFVFLYKLLNVRPYLEEMLDERELLVARLLNL